MGPEAPWASSDALLYNRRLWIVFIDAVAAATRQNVLDWGIFVMAETFSLMAVLKQRHSEDLIRINRTIAANLGSSW